MLRRIVPATAVATLLIAGLTGCSAEANQAADCTSNLTSGALSDNVAVLGSYGTQPQLAKLSNFKITDSQRTIVSEAEDRGAVAGDNTIITANIALFDAATGQSMYASSALSGVGTSSDILVLPEVRTDSLSESVRCAAAGDRVVVALSPEESLPYMAQFEGTQGASVIGVIDVVDARPLVASGPVRGLPAGYPAVVTNEDGRPGVVFPPSAAPDGTTSATRTLGDGPEVTADDNVIAQVLAVSWNGTTSLNTWDPEDIQNYGPQALGSEEQIPQSGFTFRSELTGKTVGSQVVVIENQGGLARVIVVDILGVN